ncbi:hypothetical protein QJS04_geneDACA001739 [Acorus gramineus]|uniref:Uncharacterized protein n=1 Tax=Acorus gramineus TaxID=55184 RepID=A0AAV9BKB7_ACOGR|nr:hypothetical protein QJS04_geneDACA001739 [Acorus gramineus]
MLRVSEEFEASECSSGCESGWTTYLDNSSTKVTPTTSPSLKSGGGVWPCKKSSVVVEEEEEDLSMVSDASSGPPLFFHEEEVVVVGEEGCYGFKRRRVDGGREQMPEQQGHNPLDDTASSPFFGFSKTNLISQPTVEDTLDFSLGFSATHFKGKTAMHKHLGHFHSTNPMQSYSQNQFAGKKV